MSNAISTLVANVINFGPSVLSFTVAIILLFCLFSNEQLSKKVKSLIIVAFVANLFIFLLIIVARHFFIQIG